MIAKTVHGFLLVFLIHFQLFGQGKAIVQINSSIVIDFIVIDPQGRKTGVDPREGDNPESGKRLNEIPRANYSTSGLGDSPENDDPQDSDLSHEFLCTLQSPENDGIYTIETIGADTGLYSLFVDISPKKGSNVQRFRMTVRGVADVGQIQKYQLIYSGDPNVPVKVEKIVTSSSFRQDLDNSFKLKLLGGQSFYTELLHTLDRYEKELTKRDSIGAVKDLEKFQESITSESDKRIKPNDKRFITEDARKILYDDAEYLIDRLPQAGKKEK